MTLSDAGCIEMSLFWPGEFSVTQTMIRKTYNSAYLINSRNTKLLE